MADQYIINKHGILHSIPADMAMLPGSRRATKEEIEAWQARDTAGKAAIKKVKDDARRANAAMVVNVTETPPVETPKEPAKEPKK